MYKTLIATGLALFSTAPMAHSWTPRPDWANALQSAQLSGVVASCSYPDGACQTSDLQRVTQRFIPASTYKIPHLLIAMQTGVTPAGNTVFKWDGKPQALKTWEQDHTYRGLMQDSVVPVFQGFARNIGETRMQEQLQRLGYGNADISGGIDRFWLDGGLRISAAEQIDFLTRLANNALPFAAEHQWHVKDAILLDANEHYVLRGKTGYSLGLPGVGDSARPGTGWWVGWIETGTQTHVFACNFDIKESSQLPLRKSIPLQLFAKEGWLGQSATPVQKAQ